MRGRGEGVKQRKRIYSVNPSPLLQRGNKDDWANNGATGQGEHSTGNRGQPSAGRWDAKRPWNAYKLSGVRRAHVYSGVLAT